ncbi:hypothetical protein D3C79_1056130 [compost metagenome]
MGLYLAIHGLAVMQTHVSRRYAWEAFKLINVAEAVNIDVAGCVDLRVEHPEVAGLGQ